MFDKVKKVSLGVAALTGAAVGGAAIAGAATSGSATTTKTAQSGPQRPPMNMPAHGTASHEDVEKAVSGADAEKAKAAAVKAAGGGTAGEVTTNFTGDGYEVTVTQPDGSSVEYHLDSSFNVMTGPPGVGPGGPPPWGH